MTRGSGHEDEELDDNADEIAVDEAAEGTSEGEAPAVEGDVQDSAANGSDEQ